MIFFISLTYHCSLWILEHSINNECGFVECKLFLDDISLKDV